MQSYCINEVCDHGCGVYNCIKLKVHILRETPQPLRRGLWESGWQSIIHILSLCGIRSGIWTWRACLPSSCWCCLGEESCTYCLLQGAWPVGCLGRYCKEKLSVRFQLAVVRPAWSTRSVRHGWILWWHPLQRQRAHLLMVFTVHLSCVFFRSVNSMHCMSGGAVWLRGWLLQYAGDLPSIAPDSCWR
jgi:hypothetical protein